MKKVRITVKKIAIYEDLMAEYENLIEHAYLSWWEVCRRGIRQRKR